VLPGGHVIPAGAGTRPAGTRPAGTRAAGAGGAGTADGQNADQGNEAVAPGAALPAAEVARRIGYPLLVKAAGGGGGRGLRVVRDPAELERAVAVASAEAGAAFGDPRVYLERYVERGRHVEVQLLGDGEHVIHLGDRDCSVQRRYQKLIEEAPAPALDDGLRERLRAAAVSLGDRLRYRGAGTVEFLVDADSAGTASGEFYFLEVNARVQVEHPVTEAVTGVDIVAEQLAIAEGRPLRLEQGDVTFAGHAVEVRVNAEDPGADFRPSPGTITRAVFPASAASAVRVDTHLQAGAMVPPYYDSLLAKVIAHGGDREGALAALRDALDRCAIDGVATNLGLHRALLADPEFAAGGVDTGYLARWLARDG
jgi:acetyl-CoA carboxylase biotin carboxylase subunit